MEVITITNQKGGAGKTTTAHALSSGLTLKGYKTLLIDLDPQGNLSYTMNANNHGKTILSVILGELQAVDTIQHTASGDIISSSKQLATTDKYLTDTGKEYRLAEGIERLKPLYDYIIIDTPPALSILTVNSLTASNSVIIPTQADIYGIQGILQLVDTIEPVKKYCNASLKIDGILLTRFNGRTTLSKDISRQTEDIADKLGTKLYKTRIRESIAIKEAQISQKSIFEYNPRATATTDYTAFIDEFLQERR